MVINHNMSAMFANRQRPGRHQPAAEGHAELELRRHEATRYKPAQLHARREPLRPNKGVSAPAQSIEVPD